MTRLFDAPTYRTMSRAAITLRRRQTLRSLGRKSPEERPGMEAFLQVLEVEPVGPLRDRGWGARRTPHPPMRRAQCS